MKLGAKTDFTYSKIPILKLKYDYPEPKAGEEQSKSSGKYRGCARTFYYQL